MEYHLLKAEAVFQPKEHPQSLTKSSAVMCVQPRCRDKISLQNTTPTQLQDGSYCGLWYRKAFFIETTKAGWARWHSAEIKVLPTSLSSQDLLCMSWRAGGMLFCPRLERRKKKRSWGLESRKQWHCTSPHPGPTQTEETGGPEAEGPGPWNTCWDPGHTQCWCRAGLLMVARGKPVRPPHLFGEACYGEHRDLPRGPAGAGEDPEPSLYGRFHFWESSVVRGWQSWNDRWVPSPSPQILCPLWHGWLHLLQCGVCSPVDFWESLGQQGDKTSQS